MAIAISVFKDADAIVAELVGGSIRVREAFDDPEPSPRIRCHGHRLNQVGFPGEKCRMEAIRNCDGPDSLGDGDWRRCIRGNYGECGKAQHRAEMKAETEHGT